MLKSGSGGACYTIVAFALIASFIAPATARERETDAPLHVLTSGAFTAAFGALAKSYAAKQHVTILTDFGPSMGTTPNAIPVRLDRGDPADVVILARESLDRLAARGQVDAASEVDLARSKIAMAVKEGAEVPDISSAEKLRRVLLAARSIAYSDSASGVYLQNVLFPKLGIAGQMAAKSRMIPATPVGDYVARGDYEIGFQQLSELRPIHGIRIVGFIPDALQKVTIFSAGVVTSSRRPEAARALVHFLSSSAAYDVINASGLEPAHNGGKAR